VCGASLDGLRRHAVYCSDGCRSAGRDPERATRRFDPERQPCPVCGLDMAGRREGAIYCSPVCRVRAWSAAEAQPSEALTPGAPIKGAGAYSGPGGVQICRLSVCIMQESVERKECEDEPI
jgi:hypothetical protein